MGLFRCFLFFFCLPSLTALRSFPSSVGEAHCGCRRICSGASESLASPLRSQSCDVGSVAFTTAVLPVLKADLLLCLGRSRAPREVQSESRWKRSGEGPVCSRSSSGAFLAEVGPLSFRSHLHMCAVRFDQITLFFPLTVMLQRSHEPCPTGFTLILRILKDHFICLGFNHLLRPCLFYIVKKSTPL